MRLMHFQFGISHVPGKDLSTANSLSRTPTSSSTTSDEAFSHEVAMFIALVMQHLTVTKSRLHQIAQLQEEDETCKQIPQYIVLFARMARETLTQWRNCSLRTSLCPEG